MLQAHASWETFQSDVITWDILLATVGALSKQLALPFLACVSFWKSGASFSYHPQDLFSGFAFPSQNKNIFGEFGVQWKPLELLGREKACQLPPDQMSERVHYTIPASLTEILVRKRLDKAGPPKVDWQPQMFIIYKLSLWSNAVTTNNSSGCLSIYSFILRGKADMCHIIKLFRTICFSRKHSMNSLHDNFTPGAGMPGK